MCVCVCVCVFSWILKLRHLKSSHKPRSCSWFCIVSFRGQTSYWSLYDLEESFLAKSVHSILVIHFVVHIYILKGQGCVVCVGPLADAPRVSGRDTWISVSEYYAILLCWQVTVWFDDGLFYSQLTVISLDLAQTSLKNEHANMLLPWSNRDHTPIHPHTQIPVMPTPAHPRTFALEVM